MINSASVQLTAVGERVAGAATTQALYRMWLGHAKRFEICPHSRFLHSRTTVAPIQFRQFRNRANSSLVVDISAVR